MKHKVLQIHPKDNVLVALSGLKKGESIMHHGKTYVLQNDVGAKHKFFMQDMKSGDKIIMYGTLVGKLQADVAVGSLMTTDNTKHAAQDYAYRAANYNWQPPDVSKFINRSFNGFHRGDGRVGTANYWIFLPTVFCENRNLDVIREALQNELGYSVTGKYRQFAHSLVDAFKEGKNLDEVAIDLSFSEKRKNFLFKNIDGIKFLNHQGGCGGTRQDSAMLSKLLVAYADHPNVAGVTVLSLGCQHVQ
jgi:altronate hydrolase